MAAVAEPPAAPTSADSGGIIMEHEGMLEGEAELTETLMPMASANFLLANAAVTRLFRFFE